jgi:hypothetical protein
MTDNRTSRQRITLYCRLLAQPLEDFHAVGFAEAAAPTPAIHLMPESLAAEAVKNRTGSGMKDKRFERVTWRD